MSSSGDRCPICGKPVAAAFAPFCSRRCADIDLGRWLKGGYVVPGPAAPESGKTPSDEEPEGD